MTNLTHLQRAAKEHRLPSHTKLARNLLLRRLRREGKTIAEIRDITGFSGSRSGLYHVFDSEVYDRIERESPDLVRSLEPADIRRFDPETANVLAL